MMEDGGGWKMVPGCWWAASALDWGRAVRGWAGLDMWKDVGGLQCTTGGWSSD